MFASDPSDQQKKLEDFMKARENRQKYGASSYRINSVQSHQTKKHLLVSSTEAKRLLKDVQRPINSSSLTTAKTNVEYKRRMENKKKYTPGAYRKQDTSRKESSACENGNPVTRAKSPSVLVNENTHTSI